MISAETTCGEEYTAPSYGQKLTEISINAFSFMLACSVGLELVSDFIEVPEVVGAIYFAGMGAVGVGYIIREIHKM